jgi:cell wall-associated NlpC family hydrolase
MGYGTPVSSDQLQPGDLVFYYSPVHHVAMYIGNGMIVHASSPGTPVGVAGVFSMPYSGAVRVG